LESSFGHRMRAWFSLNGLGLEAHVTYTGLRTLRLFPSRRRRSFYRDTPV
jgi:hypothetical protein